MAQVSIELGTTGTAAETAPTVTGHDESSVEPTQMFSLPPVDKGKDAWLFLLASWTLEAIIWGFAFSFGAFQDYYTDKMPIAGSESSATIGTTAIGTMYIASPFVIFLCRCTPRWTRWYCFLGLLGAAATMLFGSFSTTVTQLVMTQGFLFGLSGCFAYCPYMVYIDEWFVRRRGMAYGIVWSAIGCASAILPLAFENLLATHGFRITLRIWGGVLCLLSAPIALFIKPRVPYASTTSMPPVKLRCILSKRSVFYQVTNILQATGYFLPGIYLPTYARGSFTVSPFFSTLTLLLANISATVGTITMGSLTDKFHPTTCNLISGLGTCISCLAIWGVSSSLGGLYAFCVFYGLFAGSYTSIWSGIMRDVAREAESNGQGFVDQSLIFGWLCIGRGLANIASGPLSGALLKGMPWKGRAPGGYGSGYGTLIVYTGVSGLLSGANVVWHSLGWV